MRFGGKLAHSPGIFFTLFSGAGVGVAGIDDDAAQFPRGDVFAADFTGAAKTLLVVNVAAALASSSQTSNPTSGVGLDLIPANAAPAKSARRQKMQFTSHATSQRGERLFHPVGSVERKKQMQPQRPRRRREKRGVDS